jgi:uncharacterized protein YdaU (DUF1376 family)
MPLYIGDYLGGTSRLTTEQHGAYLLLIMDYWQNGPPPADDAVLAQIAKLDRKSWMRHRPALARYFREEGGVWLHGRIDEELAKAQERSDKAAARASSAASARWNGHQKQSPTNATSNARSNAPSIPQAVLEECPLPSPSPKEEEDANASFVVSAEPKPTRDDVRLAFEEWNDLAARLGLPTARKLDDARRKAIRTRLNDGGLEGWREALSAVAASDHCRGDNERQWKADLDFVCTASKYRRLREGSYGAPASGAADPEYARDRPLQITESLDELIARAAADIGAAA